MSPDKTYGQELVGLDFNPSGSALVSNVKSKFADIIDILDGHRNDAKNSNTPNTGAKVRALSVAITEAETACMWAVKGIVKEL